MEEAKQPAPGGLCASGSFAASLDLPTSGRLLFAAGATGVAIRAEHEIPDLYRARFARHIPSVRVQGSTVTIQYRCFPLLDWRMFPREPIAEVALNGSIPWEIEFRGGVSKLAADLRALQLVALDLNGGASKLVVTLSQPVGTSYIRIAGGASTVTFRRPAGTAVRVRVGGGVSNLTLDDEHFGAIGDNLRWETPGYQRAPDRYDIEVVGGASDMTIATR